MRLTVNGEATIVGETGSVKDLLVKLGYQDPFVAVALNRECVPRAAFDATPVKDGDEVEILAPMAGG